MSQSKEKTKQRIYGGFEQGPVRPPSEAYSLLIRVTRNCPWNRCTFCPVYKGARFSPRPVEHVLQDIDTVYKYFKLVHEAAGGTDTETSPFLRSALQAASEEIAPGEEQAFQAAVHWIMGGMRSIFIQDGNSLVIKPAGIITILEHLRDRFPGVERITTYARSDTVARIGDADLSAMAAAGLNRIHIGMESASNQVLERVQKGVTKEVHITGGLKVKQAGIELSEYYMPGLGGKELSNIHAIETADAMSKINPDFIRLRTLAIPQSIPLYEEYRDGRFEKLPEVETVKEIRLFLEELDGVTAMIKSDHILNLFQDFEGRLPEDRAPLADILENFLAMEPQEQCTYMVGRRLGYFTGLDDMKQPQKLAPVQQACRQFEVTPGNVDAVIEEIMRRFV